MSLGEENSSFDLPCIVSAGKKSSTAKTEADVPRKGCSLKKFCSRKTPWAQGHSRIRYIDVDGAKSGIQMAKCTERAEQCWMSNSAEECTCTEEKRCVSSEDLEHDCCSSKSARPLTSKTASPVEFYDPETVSMKNRIRSISSSNQKTSDVTLNARATENSDDAVNDFHDLEEPIAEAENVQSSCSLNCPKECPSYDTDSFPLLITDSQGLLEIHILSLQLSTSAEQILRHEKNLHDVSIFISWEILGETAYTSAMKCPKLNYNSSFVFRIPELFAFFEFVRSECVVFLVNVVQRNKPSYTAARTKLMIDNILDYPENKLQHIAPVKSILPCSLEMTFGQLSLWVRLSCDLEKVETFKRQCGVHSQVNYTNGTSLNTIHETQSSEESSRAHEGSKKSSIESKNLQEQIAVKKDESSEIFAESRLHSSSDTEGISVKPSPAVKRISIVGSKNEIQSTPVSSAIEEESNGGPLSDLSYVPGLTNESSSIIETMDNEDDSSDNDKIRSKLEETEKSVTEEKEEEEKLDDAVQAETASIVEFNSLLANSKNGEVSARESSSTISDLREVFSDRNWNEYKQRSLLSATAFRRNGSAGQPGDELQVDSQTEEEAIVIEIISMNLFPGSSLMNDDEVKMLYIEYSFLGYWGEDMETKSLAKSTEEMNYGFRKKFLIDEESHAVERNTLLAMLDKSIDPNIKFIVVSEPPPEEPGTKECVDIGFAVFNVKENSADDAHKRITLPIMNEKGDEQLGNLKISVWGLDTIRQCLLDDGM